MSHLVRLGRVAAFVLPVIVVAACQPAGADEGDGGPVTAADTIALGRNVVMNSGCGDCHGGFSNPSAPNWLVPRPKVFGSRSTSTPPPPYTRSQADSS